MTVVTLLGERNAVKNLYECALFSLLSYCYCYRLAMLSLCYALLSRYAVALHAVLYVAVVLL